MRLIATLTLAPLLCAALPACTPPQAAGEIATTADADLSRTEATYADAKAWADIITPLLPPERAAAVARAELIAEKALAIARAAISAAERIAALATARQATAQVQAETAAGRSTAD